MGKVKSRTRKPFIGGQKKKGKVRGRKVDTDTRPSTDVDFEDQQQLEDESKDVDFDLEDIFRDTKSASARKMSAFNDLLKPEDGSEKSSNDSYIIVKQSLLTKLISSLLCPLCSMSAVVFNLAEVNLGLAAKGILFCNSCHNVVSENYLSSRVEDSDRKSNDSFEINVRSILAFRGIGCGYESMQQWLALMNMPYSPSLNTYHKNLKKVELGAMKCFENISERTHPAIREAYEKVGVIPDKEGILDIAVSFDGSWQKRGFSSHNGTASVIDLLTGYPIDFEVLSNYCSKCNIAEERQYDDVWKASHVENCQKNFSGSAAAMEVECAKRLWTRSVEKHQFRYTTILSDGDSKAYDAVKSLEPYGKENVIVKEDCVNHVAKRMGTALRNFVESSKVMKKSVAGRGKLTQQKITKIQNYYGRAIKDNCSDAELCRRRIMAILLHISSTDENPKHSHCPPGPTSWCFFQRSIAKQEIPGPHNEHETLPVEIGKQLVPLFQRLSDIELLKRCSRNKTQNPNESFHKAIWKICPKTNYVGRRTVHTAVALAACQFTMGCSFSNIIYEILNIEPGANLKASNLERDIKRIRRAELAVTFKAKKRRKQLKYKSLDKGKSAARAEGELYSAGKFNS